MFKGSMFKSSMFNGSKVQCSMFKSSMFKGSTLRLRYRFAQGKAQDKLLGARLRARLKVTGFNVVQRFNVVQGFKDVQWFKVQHFDSTSMNSVQGSG
jgi:hypothetical protein